MPTLPPPLSLSLSQAIVLSGGYTVHVASNSIVGFYYLTQNTFLQSTTHFQANLFKIQKDGFKPSVTVNICSTFLSTLSKASLNLDKILLFPCTL